MNNPLSNVNENSMNDGLVLRCEKVCKTYSQGTQALHILSNIQLDLKASERIAIVGNSGSGKSTLLNLLAGLDSPTSGDVWINQHALKQLNEIDKGRLRNQDMGFVYQFHHLLPEFTALENVSMPMLLGATPISDIRVRAQSILSRVGLDHRLDHKPSELSGGERQRVAIARALVNNPKVVLMDEPTGNLDDITAKSVQALMVELSSQIQTAFLVVTHDMALAKQMDKVYRLTEGHLTLAG